MTQQATSSKAKVFTLRQFADEVKKIAPAKMTVNVTQSRSSVKHPDFGGRILVGFAGGKGGRLQVSCPMWSSDYTQHRSYKIRTFDNPTPQDVRKVLEPVIKAGLKQNKP